MAGEADQELIGRAVGVERFGNALMEAFDGFADGVGGLLGDAAGAKKALLLEGVDGFEIAQGFLLYRVGLIFVIENLFEFALFEEERAGSFGIIESEGALLNNIRRVSELA